MSCEVSVTTINADEWNALIEGAPDSSLQQLFEYGSAKEKAGDVMVVRHLFRQGAKVVGAAQATIRRILFLRKGLVWISRGPIIIDSTVDRNALFSDMLAALKKYWVDERQMYLRILPTALAGTGDGTSFGRLGYFVSSCLGWTSIKLDLHKSETELYQALRKRWRRYFRRIEESKVTIVSSSADTDMEALLDDYQALVKEKNFAPDAISVKFLRQLQEALPEKRKMIVFVARNEQQVLGRLLVARYGDTAMTYVIGLNAAGQNWHINHFLYWEAVKRMKKLGYRWFDLGGAHPDNTPHGILHFKQGFGGNLYQLANEIEAYPTILLYKLLNIIISKKR